MKYINFEKFILLICIFACSGCFKARAPEGDGIAAMTPALTEIVLELGLGGKLRATSPYTVDPRAKDAVRVQSSGALEIIAALRPKLVLTQGGETLLPQRLRKLNIDTKVLPMTTIGDIENAVREVGAATQTEAKAKEIVEALRGDLEKNKATYDTFSPRPKVLIIVDRLDMRMQQFYIAQHPAFLADLFEGCGMSVISGGDGAWARIDAEKLYQLNPEHIAFLERTPESAAETKKSFAARFSGLHAVRNDRLIVYDEAAITVPGPNIGKRQTDLCNKIRAFFGQEAISDDDLLPEP